MPDSLFNLPPDNGAIPEHLRDIWPDWVQYRKEIKVPLTPTAIKRQLNFLARFEPRESVSMLETAMINGWRAPWPPTGPVVRTRTQKRQDDKAAKRDPMARAIAKSGDVRHTDNIAEYQHAQALINGHDKAQRRKVVLWAMKRTGRTSLGEFAAYRTLAKVIREKKNGK